MGKEPPAILYGLPHARTVQFRVNAYIPPNDAANLGIKDCKLLAGPWMKGATAEIDFSLPRYDVDPAGHRRGGCKHSLCRGFINTELQDPFLDESLCFRCGFPFEEHSLLHETATA